MVVGFQQNYTVQEDEGVLPICVIMSGGTECSFQSSIVITMEAESDSGGKNESRTRVCVQYM